MDRKRGGAGIGDLYHEGTKYRRDEMPWGDLDWDRQPSPYKEFPDSLKRVPLMSPLQQGGKSLWETIRQRRSRREFSHEPVTFSELSQLIWATQGVTSREWGFDLRASPSAGALYPVETYIVANRVDEIPAGIYHSSVKEKSLVLLKQGSFGGDLNRAALGQEMLEDAGCVFVWTALVGRSKWKYRERAYRYIYMDAGHLGQSFYLAATALNLGCCTVGAFFDEEIDRLVGVDGRKEITVYLGAVGRIR